MNPLFHRSIALLLALVLVVPVHLVQADDYEPADEPTNSTDNFILDADNDATDITIQFGDTLGEFLRWSDSKLLFELSDDLDLLGNELVNFRVENQASDPAACNSGLSGRLYFNTGSNELQLCDGSSWGGVTGSGGVDQTNVVYVDGTRAAQTGEVYNTLGSAITYINTQSPGPTNPWVILLEPGTNTETVTLPEHTVLVGRDRENTTLTGVITLSANSAVQGVRANGGSGDIDIPAATTGYISASDVSIDDGASGGIDGTLVITESFVDGVISSSGVVFAYDSVVGTNGLTNNGTIGTYHSTVLTLTNNNNWNNFASAYDSTAILTAADRLDATNTQEAIDELVFGTSSSSFTIDQNETGNPNQDVDVIAEQGTENNGVLRYSDANNRWEISNDGAAFQPIAIGTSASDLAAVQVRQTGAFQITSATWADISFDSTDLENDPAVLEHNNSNTDRIDIKEDGIYLISYNLNVDEASVTGEFESRVQVNDASVIQGSFSSNSNYQGEFVGSSVSFVTSLNQNDFITLQAQRVSANTLSKTSDPLMSIVKLEGIQGPQGPAGSGNTLDSAYDEGGAGVGRAITVDSGAIDLNGTGELLELGNGGAVDSFLTFDDGADRRLGWDDSLSSFSTFDQQLSLRIQQSSNPPVACSASFTGQMWFDTDSGITYTCDTSNGRNKWLSINDFTLTGGESASCGAGASSGDGCTMDIHNGTDANDLGWQLPRNATIVGGSFHSDSSCTNGSGVDLEIQEGDNAGIAPIGDILTACTDANGCSATGTNIDVDADEIIRTVLDNNCSSGSVTDWSSIMILRWRHN